MNLKKINAVLVASGALMAVGIGATGTADASTLPTSPTTAIAAPQEPPEPSFIFGYYSDATTCDVVSGIVLASNSNYTKADCEWVGGAQPWALRVWYIG